MQDKEVCPIFAITGICTYRDSCSCKHNTSEVEVVGPEQYKKIVQDFKKSKKKPLKVGNTDFNPTAKNTLTSNSTSFVPGQSSNTSQQFFNKQKNDDTFNQVQNHFGFSPMNELDTELPGYFHQSSKNCDCCHGYINACNGDICESLGYCHCYASELEGGF